MKDFSKIKKLKDKLEKAVSEFNETEATKLFKLLLSEFFISKDYYQAIIISIEMQALYKILENTEKETETTILLANLFYNLKFYLLALKSSKLAIDLINNHKNHILKARALSISGKSYYAINQNDKALKTLLSAKELFDMNKEKLYSDLDTTMEYVKLLETIGNIYMNLNQKQKARIFFEKALNEYIYLENALGVSKILNNLALTYSKEKESYYAKNYLKKAFEIADKNKIIKYMISYINGVGSIFENITEFDIALKYYEEILKYCESYKNNQIKAIILKFIGSFYYKKNNYNKAILYLKESLKIIKHLKLWDEEKKILFTLSEIYKKKNDYKTSLEYYIEYSKVIDNINQRKLFLNVSIMEHEYEIYNRLLKNNRMLQKQNLILMQKSKLESLGQLASGIAHELNQPLGAISFALDNIYFVMENNKLTEDYFKQKYEIIKNNISRINRIINQIRTFSKSQNFINMEQLDLNDLISNLLLLLQTQLKNHNIKLILELEKDIGMVVGSKSRIEQVIINLISNAQYAVEKKYEQSHPLDYEKKITIRTYSDKKFVYFEVEDNGIGISKNLLDKVFDPFFTTKEVNEGTGLGLSISYGIIKKMNGNLVIKSQKNVYTKAIVSLPKYNIKKKD